MFGNFRPGRFLLSSILASCLCLAPFSTRGQEVIPVSGDTKFVHDPSIIKEGNTWYLFGTASGRVRDEKSLFDVQTTCTSGKSAVAS